MYSMLVVGGPDWFKNIMTAEGEGDDDIVLGDDVASGSLDSDVGDTAPQTPQAQTGKISPSNSVIVVLCFTFKSLIYILSFYPSEIVLNNLQ